jgi:hypothetical protein
MRNFTVHLGSATRFLRGPEHARPRSPPRPLIGQPHLSVTPPPGTVPRPTHQAPPSLICPSGTRARGARRPRAPRSGRCRATTTPVPRGTPTPGTPPFSLLFPLCCAAAEPLAPRSRCSTRSPVPTPLRPLLSSARASPLLPAPEPPPATTGSPLSLADSGRASPPSATPR